MNATVTRITSPEKSRGCWIEGSRGWTGPGYLVEIAESYGMPLDADDQAIVAAYLDSRDGVELPSGEYVTDVAEYVIGQGELADTAEQWLNDNVAPEGWAFGWHDGEFVFWPMSAWESDGIED